MKNYVYCLCVLFLFKINFVIAQNLVPNGSFENYSQCPNIPNQIYYAIGWFQPHKYIGNNSVNQSSSSDYFNLCSQSAYTRVPSNTVGHQYAFEGNAYIGLDLYSIFSNGNAYREYAEVKLNQSLLSNRKYNLKYYISMANGSEYSITKFDAYLSNDSLLYSDNDFYKINVIPQIQNNMRVNDTLNWVELTGSFIAEGGERFLTIGNFQDGILCDTIKNQGIATIGGAYYYFDDISLEEDTITTIEENTVSDFQLYPNPTKGIIAISSPQIIQELNVLDLNFNILHQQKAKSKNASLDLALEDGVYILQCKFKNGAVRHKKFVLQKE